MKRKKPKRKFSLVYSGRDMKAADAAGLAFWDSASDTQRMEAVNELVNHVSLLKGIKPNELRLCRTTAVIKRF